MGWKDVVEATRELVDWARATDCPRVPIWRRANALTRYRLAERNLKLYRRWRKWHPLQRQGLTRVRAGRRRVSRKVSDA